MSIMLFILYVSNTFAQEPLKVSLIAPGKAVAGQKFRVLLTIENQSTSGFAKFTQTLPAGFTPVEDKNQTGEFSFANNSLDVFWLRLPQKTNQYSYTVQLDDSLQGDYNFEATFSYQYKNQAATINLKNNSIEVQSINQYLAAGGNSEELENLIITPLNKHVPSVETKRTKTQFDSINQSLLVQIEIDNKNHLQKAILVENIPAELTAEVTNADGAKYKQEGNNLSFEWDKLPANKTKIEYKLKSATTQPVVMTSINGTMNLISADGNIEQKVSEPNKSLIVFNGLVKKQKTEMVALGDVNPVEEKNASKKTTNAQKMSANISTTTLATKITSTFTKSSTISYKIQIAAFSKPVAESYFKNLNISAPISKEEHNGLYKYTIGEFKTYVEADAYKEQLLKNTKLESAFITAYKKEDRIEVSTALKKTKK
jgi:hypothetical protein